MYESNQKIALSSATRMAMSYHVAHSNLLAVVKFYSPYI